VDAWSAFYFSNINDELDEGLFNNPLGSSHRVSVDKLRTTRRTTCVGQSNQCNTRVDIPGSSAAIDIHMAAEQFGYSDARMINLQSHTDMDDSRIDRAGFGRGLCVIDDTLVAAGSSPSTIALHELAMARTRSVVTLSHDIRNAIHGLEVWPFDSALGFNRGRST